MKTKEFENLEIRTRNELTRLKGARLETVENKKTRQKGEVRLDKSTMTFYGVALDEIAESTDGKLIRKWVECQLGRTDMFQWQPVIRVVYTAPQRNYTHGGRTKDDPIFSDANEPKVEIEIAADRFYIAKGPSGAWRKIGWECREDPNPPIHDFDDGQMRDGQEFALPWTDRQTRWGQSEKSIVAYSAETWTGLLLLISMLKDGRQRVLDLMRQDTDLHVFAEVGAGTLQNLLAAPEHHS